MPRRTTILMALLSLILPAAAGAQSLSELAAKEKKRKEDQKGQTKVIDADALRRAGSSHRASVDPTGSGRPAAGAAEKEAAGDDGQAAAGEPEKSARELREEGQAEWRKGLEEARAEVTRLQAEVTRLEASLADVTTGLYTPERQRRSEQLDKARADLAAAQQKVASLQTEGRRKGYR